MKKRYYRIKDRLEEWWRYPQPSWLQRHLLGIYTDSYDLDRVARRIAAETSAEYMIANMRQANNFATDYDLHDWLGSEVDQELLNDGLVLEFGVATGRTLNHFARLFPENTVHGFDSFEGLPEDWTWYIQKGHFEQPTPKVRSNVELVVGWFDETLKPFMADKQDKAMALLHIDSDLYSSAVTILDETVKTFRPGTIVLFDEYFNFPGWEQDEFRAWNEAVKKHKIKYEYIGMVTRHQKVAVRITKVGK